MNFEKLVSRLKEEGFRVIDKGEMIRVVSAVNKFSYIDINKNEWESKQYDDQHHTYVTITKALSR